MIEMIPVVEMSEDQGLKQKADNQRADKRNQHRTPEGAGDGVARDRQIGAEHILDAMGEIDEIHHAEDERQAGGDQKQQDAKLQAIQRLDGKKGGAQRSDLVGCA